MNIYMVLVNRVGDKPAGSITIVAQRKTAEMYENEFPDVANLIKSQIYVNDVITSITSLRHAKP